MRTLAYLEKTFLENLREWKILILVLVFAPFFVYLMYAYFSATAPAYRMLVLDRDQPGDLPEEVRALGAPGLVAAWREAAHPDGEPVFEVTPVDDLDAALARIERRDADLLVEIPPDYTRRLADYMAKTATTPALLVNHGDASNTRSTMAMAMSDYVAFTYVAQVTDDPSPLDVRIETVGSTAAPSEFDLYVPALLVLALIMVLFTAAAALIKEVDKGTMSRLVLSRLHTVELLTAISLNQVLIGGVALLLAFLSALSVGYRTDGSLIAVLVVGALCTLAVVAISVLVAAFMRTIFELLTVGCFPFFVLMFFSDCMFPLPKATLVTLGGFTFYWTDVLPTALAVRAFNRILNHGAGLVDVWVELLSIAVLTLGYYALGIWLFMRRHYKVW